MDDRMGPIEENAHIHRLEDRVAQLEREREADRAAINDADMIQYHGGYDAWKKKHAAAIQRAQDAKG